MKLSHSQKKLISVTPKDYKFSLDLMLKRNTTLRDFLEMRKSMESSYMSSTKVLGDYINKKVFSKRENYISWLLVSRIIRGMRRDPMYLNNSSVFTGTSYLNQPKSKKK